MTLPRFRDRGLPVLFYLATCLTTTGAGAALSGHEPFGSVSAFLTGLPFSLSLMGILTAHEAGHYYVARKYGVVTSLPWFIPAPTLIGTFGAIIRLPRFSSRKIVLFDIALAGPIAGLIPSLFALAVGIHLSGTLPASAPLASGLELGDSLLFKLMTRCFSPDPSGAGTLLLSPVGFAGWVGLLVTSLNLIPAGQLDGGHLFYALLGKKIFGMLKWVIPPLLFLLGYFGWKGWWVWTILLVLMGGSHPSVEDESETLPLSRKWMGLGVFLLELVIFVPFPLRVV